MNQKENIFYNPKEKRAFWVAGHTDNTFFALEQARILARKASEFAGMAGIDKELVCTSLVLNSSKYEDMRVFYGDCQEAPKGSFILSIHETMDRFLKG